MKLAIFSSRRLGELTSRKERYRNVLSPQEGEKMRRGDSKAIGLAGGLLCVGLVFSALGGAAPRPIQHVFVRDTQLGTTELIDVSDAGAPANEASVPGGGGLAISADGRFVAFPSYGSNLVSGDLEMTVDVFLRDRALRTTKMMSVTPDGVPSQQPQHVAYFLSMSADGRKVAWVADDSSMAPGAPSDDGGSVYVRDTSNSVTTREGETGRYPLCATPGCGRPNTEAFTQLTDDGSTLGYSTNVVDWSTGTPWGYVWREKNLTSGSVTALSPDLGSGRPYFQMSDVCVDGDSTLVTFDTTARLVPEDTDAYTDVYTIDRSTGQYDLLNVDLPPLTSPEVVAGGHLRNGRCAGGPDNRYVPVMASTSDGWTVFVFDRDLGQTTQQTMQCTCQPMGISDDGSKILLNGMSTVDGAPTSISHIYLQDRVAHGSTPRVLTDADVVDRASNGQPSESPSFYAVMSGDARWVAFASEAFDITGGLDASSPVFEPYEDVSAVASSVSGAVVNYAPPIAIDETSGPAQVVCNPPSGSTFTLGDSIVLCSAIDDAGNEATLSFTVHVRYGWSGFLQPINDTGHQTGVGESRFKLGSTVPAKFQLTSASGAALQALTAPRFARSANRGACDSVTSDEAVAFDPATAGSTYTLSGAKYQYNWRTSGLTAGEYRIFALLDDGTQRYVDICLR